MLLSPTCLCVNICLCAFAPAGITATQIRCLVDERGPVPCYCAPHWYTNRIHLEIPFALSFQPQCVAFCGFSCWGKKHQGRPPFLANLLICSQCKCALNKSNRDEANTQRHTTEIRESVCFTFSFCHILEPMFRVLTTSLFDRKWQMFRGQRWIHYRPAWTCVYVCVSALLRGKHQRQWGRQARGRSQHILVSVPGKMTDATKSNQ